MAVSGYEALLKNLRNTPSTGVIRQSISNRKNQVESLIRQGRFDDEILSIVEKHRVIDDRQAREIERNFDLEDGWLDLTTAMLTREQLTTVRINNLSALCASEHYCDTVYDFLIKVGTSDPASTLEYFFDTDYCPFEQLSYYLRRLEDYLDLRSNSLDDEMFSVPQV